MDPDSFRGKIFLNTIDKLVLGLAATVLFFVVQHYVQENDKKVEQRAVVARVQSDVLIQQRKNLSEAVEKYLMLLEQTKVRGRASTQTKPEFVALRQRVYLALDTAEAMAPEFGKDRSAAGLRESIREMNKHLMSQQGLTADDIEKREAKIRQEYAAVLVALRDVTMVSVDIEGAKARFIAK